jgi:hypothetical protein
MLTRWPLCRSKSQTKPHSEETGVRTPPYELGGHQSILKGMLGPGTWHMPGIPATQEAEIGRIGVQGQPRQKVRKIPSQSIS